MSTGGILVVDDNETHRYTVRRILRNAGYAVSEAATAEEALQALEERTPRLIILDVQLPDMDGREMCRRIKASPATAAVIVLQVSATYVRDEDMVQALDSGADASLAEPIEPTVLVATVRALLRAREAEDALRDALEQTDAARRAAEDLNRAKDEFLATLSHELRSPLGAILTWATLLIEGDLDDERRHRALAAIERNARAQAQLIEDLLDVSRIVSGGMRLERAAVELPGIIEAAAEVVRPTADAKGVALELTVDAMPEPISADPHRLRQAVCNVLGNAVKFTPAGGRVEVRLERRDRVARIVVRDTGRGIDPALLGEVFERFRQEDASSTRREGGLGLGLTIARHLMELHGGRVEAHSDGVGKGATFVLELPLTPSTSGTPAGRAPTTAGTVGLVGLRVLLVDDEADAREASRAALEAAGATVVSAGSVVEALQQLGNAAFDTVVTDIAMPDLDGYTLLERMLRQGGRVATTPAIALTAYAGADDQRRVTDAGFARHVAKPVAPSELVNAVGSVARRDPS
jgi:signal transduction histidine kinase